MQEVLLDTELIDQLRRCGLRATSQRLTILKALRADRTHPSAEELFERLRPHHATLSLSTVYKTLQTLAQKGVLQTIDSGPGRQRFEGSPAPHHHAVCTYCGRVFDVEFSRFPIEPPKRSVHPDIYVQGLKVCFTGLCRFCNGQRETASPSGIT